MWKIKHQQKQNLNRHDPNSATESTRGREIVIAMQRECFHRGQQTRAERGGSQDQGRGRGDGDDDTEVWRKDNCGHDEEQRINDEYDQHKTERVKQKPKYKRFFPGEDSHPHKLEDAYMDRTAVYDYEFDVLEGTKDKIKCSTENQNAMDDLKNENIQINDTVYRWPKSERYEPMDRDYGSYNDESKLRDDLKTRRGGPKA